MKKILTLLAFLMMIFTFLSGCNEEIGNTNESNNESSEDNQDNSLPIIENIGIEIDYYNDTTNKAGDFQFDTFTYSWGGIYNEKIFYDYGDSSINETGAIKLEPQPIFIVPLGTKVHAITSGVVSDISTLYSGDYTIHVIKENNPKWVYEHEHVINVSVNIGDKVTAGQEIAEVSDYNSWLKADGYGVLDIGILTTTEDGNPEHHCPFMYLNESVKDDYLEKINALYESWETYTGNSSLYEEDEHVIPGCITCDPIND